MINDNSPSFGWIRMTQAIATFKNKIYVMPPDCTDKKYVYLYFAHNPAFKEDEVEKYKYLPRYVFDDELRETRVNEYLVALNDGGRHTVVLSKEDDFNITFDVGADNRVIQNISTGFNGLKDTVSGFGDSLRKTSAMYDEKIESQNKKINGFMEETKTNFSTISQTIDGIKSSIGSSTGDVSGFEKRLSVLEQTTNGLSGSISTVRTELTSKIEESEKQINEEIKSKEDSVKNSLTEVKNKTDKLKDGNDKVSLVNKVSDAYGDIFDFLGKIQLLVDTVSIDSMVDFYRKNKDDRSVSEYFLNDISELESLYKTFENTTLPHCYEVFKELEEKIKADSDMVGTEVDRRSWRRKLDVVIGDTVQDKYSKLTNLKNVVFGVFEKKIMTKQDLYSILYKLKDIVDLLNENKKDCSRLTVLLSGASITSNVSDWEINDKGLNLSIAETVMNGKGIINDKIASINATLESFKTTIAEANKTQMTVIEQRANSIKSEVSNTIDGKLSSFEQTANEMKQIVKNIDGSIQSKVSQATNNITSQVSSLEGKISSLSIAMEGINSSVRDSTGRVSNIAQTVDRISINFSGNGLKTDSVSTAFNKISSSVEIDSNGLTVKNGKISVDALDSTNTYKPRILLFSDTDDSESEKNNRPSIDATYNRGSGRGNSIRFKWDSSNYVIVESGRIGFYVYGTEMVKITSDGLCVYHDAATYSESGWYKWYQNGRGGVASRSI